MRWQLGSINTYKIVRAIPPPSTRQARVHLGRVVVQGRHERRVIGEDGRGVGIAQTVPDAARLVVLHHQGRPLIVHPPSGDGPARRRAGEE